MPISYRDAFVPACQQALGGLLTVIDKGESFARQSDLGDADLFEARLAEDMWPLPWHVRSCWMHSAYALEQLQTGEFTPDFTEIPDDWDAMRAMIAAAQNALSKADEATLEAIADKDIAFMLGGQKRFGGKGSVFLLNFHLPNLYFHAATFYDILRMKGVPLSKMDYMGPLPTGG